MKKSNVILVLGCIIGISFTSCLKDNESVLIHKNCLSSATAQKLITISTKSNSGFSGNYVLSAKAGHSSSDCNSSCITFGGIKRHVNCQGFGNNCAAVASVSVSKVEPENSNDPNYTAIGLNDYEPSDDTIYNMPARSYYIQNNEFENGYIWLNIPSQILERDYVSHQFLYFKISFTNQALFED